MSFVLTFTETTAVFPAAGVTTTARRGREWFDRIEAGDILELCLKNGSGANHIGLGIVTSVVLTDLQSILARAGDNHIVQAARERRVSIDAKAAETLLMEALVAAYPELATWNGHPPETFTRISFVRIPE